MGKAENSNCIIFMGNFSIILVLLNTFANFAFIYLSQPN